MDLQKMLSYTRRCVDDYQMISEGDKIAVGISGGKDSLSMLMVLKALQRFYPKHFELEAVTVDLGFENLDLDQIRKFCADLDVNYTVIPTQIAQIVFEERKEENPCSLCAKMRKGTLNYVMHDKGFNKVAYAHHRDDLVETLMMSMIYEGRLHTFSPVTYLEGVDMTIIRPFLYVHEPHIIGFANKMQLPVCKSPCPADGHTRREYVKQLIRQINRENPGAIDRMFHAACNGNLPGWPDLGHVETKKENCED